MSDTVSTTATGDPVSLADVKEHLNVTSNDDDNLLAGYIKAATNMLEARARRCFMHQTRQLKMRTFADSRYVQGRRIYPPRSPLSSVSSITYVDTAGTTQTLSSTRYISSTGDKPGFISESYNNTWPDTRVHDNDVTVTYVTGHSSAVSSVPQHVKLALKQVVAHWYRNREAATDGTMKELPIGIDALLEQEAVEAYG